MPKPPITISSQTQQLWLSCLNDLNAVGASIQEKARLRLLSPQSVQRQSPVLQRFAQSIAEMPRPMSPGSSARTSDRIRQGSLRLQEALRIQTAQFDESLFLSIKQLLQSLMRLNSALKDDIVLYRRRARGHLDWDDEQELAMQGGVAGFFAVLHKVSQLNHQRFEKDRMHPEAAMLFRCLFTYLDLKQADFFSSPTYHCEPDHKLDAALCAQFTKRVMMDVFPMPVYVVDDQLFRQQLFVKEMEKAAEEFLTERPLITPDDLRRDVFLQLHQEIDRLDERKQKSRLSWSKKRISNKTDQLGQALFALTRMEISNDILHRFVLGLMSNESIKTHTNISGVIQSVFWSKPTKTQKALSALEKRMLNAAESVRLGAF